MFTYWYAIVIFVVFAVVAVSWSIYRRQRWNRLHQQQQSPLIASPQGFAHTGGGGGGGVYHYDSHQQQQQQQYHYQQQYGGGGVVLGQPHPHPHQHGGAPAPGTPMHYGTGQEAYFPAAQQQYQQPLPQQQQQQYQQQQPPGGVVNSYEQFPTVGPTQQQGHDIYGGNIYTQPPPRQ